MNLSKRIQILILFAFVFSKSIIAQNRLIKAHSDQEDRIISSNLGLIDPFRNYKQSKRFITPLMKSGLSINDSSHTSLNFNQKNFNYFAWNNPEFSGNHRTAFTQKSWVYKLGGPKLWQNPNRFFSWESKDREDYLVVNPILDLSYGPSLGSLDTQVLNGRGVELYGQMGEKLAFYSQIYDYQANYQEHIDHYNRQFKVFPGLGNVQTNSFGFNDYFYATAYMDVLLLKKQNDTTGKGYEITATMGHDKQHIGSGFRSLIMSNFTTPSLFLQVNYKLGPFKYQNLFKELISDMSKDSSKTFNKKYLAMHRGSLEFEKIGLELGFSEMVIQSRPNSGFDINYLNPVIFYRAIERDLGSSDNALIAFDAKWKKNQFLFYGQLIIDEFNFSSVFGNRNSYLNKFGNQLGLYYKPNISSLKQSYIQLEYNAVRPYTYSHRRNSSNYYGAFNQALAHPLESNFREVIFRFFAVPKNYQRWAFKNTTQLAWKGLDLNGENYGGNIRKPYSDAMDRENAIILQGNLQNRINVLTTLMYYVQPNAKIEISHHWFHTKDQLNSGNWNYLSLSIKYNFTDTRESYLF